MLVEGGGVKLKVHVDDVLDDWDSDPELETAQIREASRVRRGHVVARQHNSGSSSSGGSSGRRLENELPFYSTVVEPAMALGQQWPPRPAQPRGFQRYQSGYKVPPLHEPQVVHIQSIYVCSQSRSSSLSYKGFSKDPSRCIHWQCIWTTRTSGTILNSSTILHDPTRSGYSQSRANQPRTMDTTMRITITFCVSTMCLGRRRNTSKYLPLYAPSY